MNNMLLASSTVASGGSLIMIILVYVVIIGGFMWFMGRPQKKKQKALEEKLSKIQTGDSIMTTSGFYGTVLVVEEDTVIVEFGNNKNCRIPMQKAAIAEVESSREEDEE